MDRRILQALRATVLAPALLLLAPIAHGADADFLSRYAATYRFRLGRPSAVEITPDGGSVLFLRSGPRGFDRDLYEMKLPDGPERLLLRSEDLLGASPAEITPEEKARRERMRLAAGGIAAYELSADGSRVLVPLGGRLFLVDREDGGLREIGSSAGFPIDPRFSPDGTKVACVREGDLYVIDLSSGRETRLTRGANENLTHGVAEFVAQEEMGRRKGYWWSPDSKRIVYQRTDTSAVERFYIADSMRPEREPDAWPYPRPGATNASVELGIIPVKGGETLWIEWDRATYEYLAAVRWTAGAPLTLLVQNRRQTEERLLSVDAKTGETSTLLAEQDDAWLNLHAAMPRWLPDGRRFLWISENSGMPRLELRDRDGSLVRTLHETSLGLRRFELLLDGGRNALVQAGSDPTRSSLFRIPLDEPGEPVSLVGDDGVRSVVSGAGGRDRFAYRAADATGHERYVVTDSTGSLAVEIPSAVESHDLQLQLEFVEIGDGIRFHAVLVRPAAFDPAVRYPVLIHVYGGPGAQRVRRDGTRYLIDQWFANHGYVVVSIDGRGTPGRGRDWERAIKGDLIEIPLADQFAALEALGDRYPELDLERVGIHGWSFGGYFSAMAALRRPGRVRAAVAGAPVVSWSGYDTHYTERYMDLPQRNPDGYASADVLTYASRLERPLLLIHGTADDNVYFMHSLELADALLREGKTFQFLPLPGFTHMVTDPEVIERMNLRKLDFFDRHVATGEEPSKTER
jgi:dipeptidyl-peptidase-4